MTWLLDLLTGDLGKWLAGAVIALLGALGIYAKGRSDANAKAEVKRAKEALETHERINEAEVESDPDAARAWLGRHSERLRDKRKP